MTPEEHAQKSTDFDSYESVIHAFIQLTHRTLARTTGEGDAYRDAEAALAELEAMELTGDHDEMARLVRRALGSAASAVEAERTRLVRPILAAIVVLERNVA